MQNIIHVEDLSISYQTKPVIWDVDLDIPQNAMMAIVGPNGAGKSTLIKGILNLIPHMSGKIEVLGSTYKKHLKKIAYVPQIGSVNWDFPTTVLDVVTMGRYVHLGWIKRPSKKDKDLALEALKLLDMEMYSNRQISQLSGGQRQRVFIARALVQDADIYFLDEPMQGIDIKSEEIIFNILKELQEKGKTIIVVHHDLKTVPQHFDYVTLINKKIVASGKTTEVFTEENIQLAYRGSKNEFNID